jgi:hypothetical protein
MASKRRIWAAFLVLLAGAAATALLLQKNEVGDFEISLQAGEPSNRFAKLLGLEGEGSAEKNLTEEVFQKYGAEILRANQSGSKTGGVYLPKDSLLEEIINQEASKGFTFQKIFTQKDFQTTANNSSDLVKNYLAEIGKTYDQNSSGKEFLLSVAEMVADNKPENLRKYIAGNRAQIADLLTISVPPTWLGFQVELTNVLNQQAEIGDAILKMEEDPIFATLAIQQIEEVSQKELGLFAMIKNNLISN